MKLYGQAGRQAGKAAGCAAACMGRLVGVWLQGFIGCLLGTTSQGMHDRLTGTPLQLSGDYQQCAACNSWAVTLFCYYFVISNGRERSIYPQ